jgi:hypothetical protein
MKLAIYCPGGSDLSKDVAIDKESGVVEIPELKAWSEDSPPLPILEGFWNKVVALGGKPNEITIAFLLTEQYPRQSKDTNNLKGILEVWADLKGIDTTSVAFAFIDAPHSRKAMLSSLPDLLDTLIRNVSPSEVFISQGPGTDAMNAAVLLSMLSGLRLRLPVRVVELVGVEPDGAIGRIDTEKKTTRADDFDPSIVTSRLVRTEIALLLTKGKIGNASSLYSLAPEALSELLERMLCFLSNAPGSSIALADHMVDVGAKALHGDAKLPFTSLVAQMLDVIECVDTDAESVQIQTLPLMIFQIVQDLLPTMWAESLSCPRLFEPIYESGTHWDAGLSDRVKDKAKRLMLSAGPSTWDSFPRAGRGNRRLVLDATGSNSDLVRTWAHLRHAVSEERNKLAHGVGQGPNELAPFLQGLAKSAIRLGALEDILSETDLLPSNLRSFLRRYQPAIPTTSLLQTAAGQALKLCNQGPVP